MGTNTTESQRAFTSTYWQGTNDQAEVARLDGMHQGTKAYLDGKIFLAPLENPQTILDVGAGSGIWAIDIADKFPNAQVTAADISPMVPRVVPPNFQFQQVDILVEPLPWEPSSFDVVHVRFLLLHLPDPQRVLERIARLVKLGGWLLVEDVSFTGDVKPEGDAPAVRMSYRLLCEYWESNGQVPRVGENLESWLRQTGSFSEINAHEVIIPVGNHPSTPAVAAVQNSFQQREERVVDPKLRVLALIFTEASRRSFAAEKLHPRMLALGYTPELKRQCMEQYGTLEWWMDVPLHFVWARKSV